MRLSLAIAVVMFVPGPGWAQDAGPRYAAAYRVTGFRLRAVSVCSGDKKALLQHAFVSISSPEFKQFSQAYPETTKRWMMEGAGAFNDAVMRSGIPEACRQAR